MSPRPEPELPPEALVRDGAARNRHADPRTAPADALRDIVDLVVGSPIPDEILAAEADVLRGVAERLQAASEGGRRTRGAPDITRHPGDFFPSSPMSGPANPLSPPIAIWGEDDEDGSYIAGRAIFTVPYEGPPTCVHGGMISLLFDEILGNANLIAGRPGMTGTLTVRYRRPTPLMTPLELYARQIGVEGRKIRTVGTISVAGEVTAEAEAVFIEVPPTRMLGIVERNAERADGDVMDDQMAQAIRDQQQG